MLPLLLLPLTAAKPLKWGGASHHRRSGTLATAGLLLGAQLLMTQLLGLRPHRLECLRKVDIKFAVRLLIARGPRLREACSARPLGGGARRLLLLLLSPGHYSRGPSLHPALGAGGLQAKEVVVGGRLRLLERLPDVSKQAVNDRLRLAAIGAAGAWRCVLLHHLVLPAAAAADGAATAPILQLPRLGGSGELLTVHRRATAAAAAGAAAAASGQRGALPRGLLPLALLVPRLALVGLG